MKTVRFLRPAELEMLDADWRLADEIRNTGYELDEPIDYRFSIVVVSQAGVRYMRENGFQFLQNVDADAVQV